MWDILRASLSKSPSPPPLSCNEPEMRLPLGAFFFLSQRRLAETPEPRRLAPGPISVSERPSVSNRANLVRPGSASRRPTFSASSFHRIGAPSAAVLPAGVASQTTRGRRFMASMGAVARTGPYSRSCFGCRQRSGGAGRERALGTGLFVANWFEGRQ